MDARLPDSHVYYFSVGRGSWGGRFSFRVEDWPAFRRARLGFWNRFLVLGMAFIEKLPGSAIIDSTLRGFPEWGPNGVATNVVRIRRFGLTLYLLREQYVLDPDGTRVFVQSRERFGPVPFLFRTTKRHPARIHPGGRGATYLDMPLLGDVWDGNYEVLDPDHIDASLTCGWASAKEVISRVVPRSDGGAAGAHREPADDAGGLDAVVRRLQAYRDWYEAVRDPRAVFAHAYATITQIFREEIPRTPFEDRDWVVALDVAFAREYFRALDAQDLGLEVPGGWRPVFDAIGTRRTSVLEELVLSMSAHIIHDLPLALVQVGLKADGRSRVGDFHRANDVLEHGIDRIQEAVARRYNPLLSRLDRAALREDEVLTNYGIRLSRAAAWFNGERLTDPASAAAARASIVRSCEVVVARLVKPPLLSLRLLVRLARLLSRLTRRWPGRPVL